MYKAPVILAKTRGENVAIPLAIPTDSYLLSPFDLRL
jgi:hypothetical protein